MADQRTEKATQKKRLDARKKGQIARGPELPSTLAFLGALLTLKFISGDIFEKVGVYIQNSSLKIAALRPLTEQDVNLDFLDAGRLLAALCLPVILVGFAAVCAGNFAQGGFSFTGEAMKPKGDKFNPAKNIKKIFGLDSVFNLAKSMVKLAVIAVVAYGVLVPVIESAPSFISAPLGTVIIKLGDTLFSLAFRCGLVLLALAAADYGYAWYKNEKSLRMTKQEIRDEYKQQEGDPNLKGQRRRMARETAQKRSMAQVPKASVIITNPTHFAVALRYDRDRDAAPIVVAKGADNVAAKIREIAREHDIPMVENPPLARALYRSVEPNQIIPVEFFGVVAEILAFVFRQKERSSS